MSELGIIFNFLSILQNSDPTCSHMYWKVSSVIFPHQSALVAEAQLMLWAGLSEVVPWEGAEGWMLCRELCARVTVCLVLPCVPFLTLLIILISLQAMGFLSISALLTPPYIINGKQTSSGGSYGPTCGFWWHSRTLSALTSFWLRFHTSLRCDQVHVFVTN